MTIDRRTFVQTATVLAVAAAGTQAARAQAEEASRVMAAFGVGLIAIAAGFAPFFRSSTYFAIGA